METLNDKIIDILDNSIRSFDWEIFGVTEAAKEIEKLILQEKISMLNDCVDELNGYGESQCANYIESKIEQLATTLSNLTTK